MYSRETAIHILLELEKLDTLHHKKGICDDRWVELITKELNKSQSLKVLQIENKEWANHNFPNKKSWQPLLGVVEEVGELAHAHLKATQKIRGNEQLRYLAIDAIGDVVIYLADYCNQMGFDLEEIVKMTWKQVKQRDWKKNPETGKKDE